MKNSRRALGVIAISLAFFGAAAQAGPTSALYLTDFSQQVFVVEGGNVSPPWTNPAGSLDASPSIAVSSTVRTYGQGFGAPSSGYEFTLDGTPTGATYAQTLGCCFRDGTTDGMYNYALREQAGDNVAYRFGLDWSNPEIFDLSSHFPGDTRIFTIGNATGITWDPRDNSFWLAGDTSLFNVSSTGEILAFFLTGVTSTDYAVAFDAADNTLWMSAFGAGQTTLYQYDAAKVIARPVPLDSVAIANIGLVGGAEFALAAATPAVPEPAGWAMMVLGFGLAGGMVRYRRRYNFGSPQFRGHSTIAGHNTN